MINNKNIYSNFKRALGLGISGLMAASSFNLAVFANANNGGEGVVDYGEIEQKFDLGNNVTGTFTEDGTLVVEGEGKMKDYEEVNKNPLYDIRKDIKKIIFDDEITDIGSWTSRDCENLKGIRLPDGLRKVYYRSFANCKGLEEVSLPDDLTEIEKYAFGNSNLKKIYVKKGSSTEKLLNGYSDEDFKDIFGKERNEIEIVDINEDQGVEEFNLGYDVTGTFYKDSGTLVVTRLYNDLTRWYNYRGFIEDGGKIFDYEEVNKNPLYDIRKDIKKIIFDDEIRYIGHNAFAGCENLTEVKWPENLQSIGRGAFQDCSKLCSESGGRLDLPDSVDIAMIAFYGCTSLKEVKLPASLYSFGFGMFIDCNLEKIYVKRDSTAAKSLDLLPNEYYEGIFGKEKSEINIELID